MRVRLRFQITQHSRDVALMSSLVKYFDCGVYFANPARDAGDFVVTRFSDIHEKIIPFFNKYPIVGVKAKDFSDFKQVMDIMKVKGHLTPVGLEQILKIKAGMNTGRPPSDENL